jgi:hypothetical protein
MKPNGAYKVHALNTVNSMRGLDLTHSHSSSVKLTFIVICQ